MSYGALETSVHSAQPVELYRFTSGLRKWLYTSSDAAQVLSGEVYEPYPLRRTAFKQTQELNKSTLEISAPRDLPFVADAIASPLLGVVLLTVYRVHRADTVAVGPLFFADDLETITFWKGRVDGVRFVGSETTISCAPLATSLRRIALRRPAQRQCPHALYERGCELSEAAWEMAGNLVSHTGALVVSGVFSTQPDGWWVGGKITFYGIPRFIVDHVGDTVTLTAPVPGLSQTAAFLVYAGCDHSPVTCDSKFNNILNYGGAPWFPIKNPFSGDSPA